MVRPSVVKMCNFKRVVFMKKICVAVVFSCAGMAPLYGAQGTGKQSDSAAIAYRALVKQGLEGTVQGGLEEVEQKKDDNSLKELLDSLPKLNIQSLHSSEKKEENKAPYEEVFMVHGKLYKIVAGKIVPIAGSSKPRKIKIEGEELL